MLFLVHHLDLRGGPARLVRKRLLLLSVLLKRLHFFSLTPQLRVAIMSAHTTAPRCAWDLIARFQRCAVLFLHQRLSHLRGLGAARAEIPEIQGHRRTVADRRGLSLLTYWGQGRRRGLEAREEGGSTFARCEGARESGWMGDHRALGGGDDDEDEGAFPGKHSWDRRRPD